MTGSTEVRSDDGELARAERRIDWQSPNEHWPDEHGRDFLLVHGKVRGCHNKVHPFQSDWDI